MARGCHVSDWVQVVNFAGELGSITNVAITTNVATLLAVNTFTVGEDVTISALVTATFLNGQTVTVTAASGTHFSFTFAHGDYVSAADTGTASNTAGTFIALATTRQPKATHPGSFGLRTSTLIATSLFTPHPMLARGASLMWMTTTFRSARDQLNF